MELNYKIRMLRDHGQEKKYHHNIVGWNARMDGIQGAILNVKLKYLEEWNKMRRKNTKFYDKLMTPINEIITPKENNHCKHIYHIYAIRVKNRNKVINTLSDKNIHCGIHYPVPLHLQGAYSYLGYKENSFQIVEKCSREFVSLPMFPELTKVQIEYIVSEIKSML